MSVSQLHPGDYAVWAELWRQYLAFYETTLPEQQYQNTWARLLDPAGDLHAVVVRDAEAGGTIVGLAHYLFHVSSWSDKPVCYLNDLFVEKDRRTKGYGRKLILATAQAAHDKGCDKLYWATQEHNATARRLYDTLGKLEFVQYAMPLPTDKLS